MDRSQSPVVSVIIATYNRKRYLQQAIDSVLGQTYHNIELIVVDDGSTDGTRDFIHEHYENRLNYIYQANQGRSAARNTGLSAATGKYIAFLDSDDRWLPEKLARQVAFMEQYPEFGLTHTFSKVITENGEPNLAATQEWHLDYLRTVKRGYSYEALTQYCLMFLSTVIIRTDLVARVGFMDNSIPAFEDWDWYLRAALVTSIGILQEDLTDYRLHDENTTHAEFIEGRTKTSLKHLALIKDEHGIPRRQAACNLCLQLATSAYYQEDRAECTRWTLRALSLDPLRLLRPVNARYLLFSFMPGSLVRGLRRKRRERLESHL